MRWEGEKKTPHESEWFVGCCSARTTGLEPATTGSTVFRRRTPQPGKHSTSATPARGFAHSLHRHPRTPPFVGGGGASRARRAVVAFGPRDTRPSAPRRQITEGGCRVSSGPAGQ